MGGKFENPESGIPASLEAARILEELTDPKEITKQLRSLLDALPREIGKEFTGDVASIYRGMQKEECLARVEKLSRVLGAVELGELIHISDENESHYANAVLPELEGLKIAFAEGQAPGPVRSMVAFGKTVVGFKTDNLKVDQVEFDGTNFQNVKERRYLCRHVSGDLRKEDIRYMVLRVPTHMMPEEHLSEPEKAKKAPFTFRGIQF